MEKETKTQSNQRNEQDKSWLPSLLSYELSDFQKNMIAGGISGSVGKTVTAPFTRLTILFQLNKLKIDSTQVIGFRELYRSVLEVSKKEGILSFWKGNFMCIVHRFPYSAINFSLYGYMRQHLLTYKQKESIYERFIFGAIAGMVACFIAYPLDLIRTKISANMSTQRLKAWSVIQTTYQVEGYRGFYKGLNASLAVSIPALALNYTIYGTAKSYATSYKLVYLYHPDTNHLTLSGSLLCGAFTGIITSLVTFPIDLIRRRKQMANLSDSINKTTVPTQLMNIVRNEGLLGLYKGVLPDLLKIIPMASVTFATFELCSRLFGTKHSI